MVRDINNHERIRTHSTWTDYRKAQSDRNTMQPIGAYRLFKQTGAVLENPVVSTS